MNRGQAKEFVFKKIKSSFHEAEAARLSKWLIEDLACDDYSIEFLNPFIQRLIQNEPIQYVTEKAHFYGRVFYVDSDVLIPRPETEELVYTCLKNFGFHTQFSILDIGTGSGCIPITLKNERPKWNVSALDVSEKALNVAIQNAQKLDADVSFIQADILDKQQWNSLPQVDLIISNPPYIPNKEKELMASQVLDFEPHLALFVDNKTPLLFYEKLASLGKQMNASVLCELNEFYSEESKQLFEEKFYSVEIIDDLQGKPRVLLAQG